MAPSPTIYLLPPPAAEQDTIAYLSEAFQKLSRKLLGLLLLLLLLGLVLLLGSPSRLPVFMAAALPGLIVAATASRGLLGALPIFPLYVSLQALSFCSPLFSSSIGVDWRIDVSPELLGRCVLPLLLWFTALWLGWQLTPLSAMAWRYQARPLSEALQEPGWLPHSSLGLVIALQLLIGSSLYWQFLGPLAQGLRAPIYAVINLATITGAFTGAYSWAHGRLRSPPLWLLLFLVPFFQGLSSLLLSSSQTMVIAALLGLWLGRSRQALAITLASLLLLAFLHNGKYALRQTYWNTDIPLPSNPIVLIREWVGASLSAGSQSADDSPSNLFSERFNNLQNLLYVEQELASGTPPLGGESLSVIPQVLVPRILSSEKVRSHEGQVLLNLHFGRQRSREDTETSYIAWGFLAEGVGNFGSLLGPVVMGLVTGALLRISENLGRGQLILSTPGLLSLSLLVFWLTSYEMAASTFAAAGLQVIVVVLLVSWWFGQQRPSAEQPR